MSFDNRTVALLGEPTKPNKFLINTSKALKGSKLTTKDFVRNQLMKFKYGSNKY